MELLWEVLFLYLDIFEEQIFKVLDDDNDNSRILFEKNFIRILYFFWKRWQVRKVKNSTFQFLGYNIKFLRQTKPFQYFASFVLLCEFYILNL